MLLRFVITQFDPRFGRRQGLFQAALAPKRTGTLSATGHDALEGILPGFGKGLQTPIRLTPSTRPGRQLQAICRFKDSAVTGIAKIRECGLALERYGLLVEELSITHPGCVGYQDQH